MGVEAFREDCFEDYVEVRGGPGRRGLQVADSPAASPWPPLAHPQPKLGGVDHQALTFRKQCSPFEGKNGQLKCLDLKRPRAMTTILRTQQIFRLHL